VGSPRRLLFLSGSRYSRLGGEIASRLPSSEWEMHALAERVTMDRARSLTVRRVATKVRELVESKLARLLSCETASPALCDVPGVRVHQVDKLGDPQSLELVRELAPFACINTGGCGILRRQFLAATGPVLNVHCGLPRTRGFNAVEWSAWHRLAVRLCVHLLDAGIDTGPVVLAREFPIIPGATADQLRVAYEDHYADLIVGALERLVEHGPAAATAQDPAAGRTFYAMHRSLRAALDARLACGDAPATWPAPTPKLGPRALRAAF
jgi:methionyl-tRNA formyltransferase